jgi:hypothetical protein
VLLYLKYARLAVCKSGFLRLRLAASRQRVRVLCCIVRYASGKQPACTTTAGSAHRWIYFTEGAMTRLHRRRAICGAGWIQVLLCGLVCGFSIRALAPRAAGTEAVEAISAPRSVTASILRPCRHHTVLLLLCGRGEAQKLTHDPATDLSA